MSNNNISPAITLVITCSSFVAGHWSLLHSELSKQFLVLSGNNSKQGLFQQVIARINSIGNDLIKLGEGLASSIYQNYIS